MKLSAYIQELQDLLKDHGDLEVRSYCHEEMDEETIDVVLRSGKPYVRTFGFTPDGDEIYTSQNNWEFVNHDPRQPDLFGYPELIDQETFIIV